MARAEPKIKRQFFTLGRRWGEPQGVPGNRKKKGGKNHAVRSKNQRFPPGKGGKPTPGKKKTWTTLADLLASAFVLKVLNNSRVDKEGKGRQNPMKIKK